MSKEPYRSAALAALEAELTRQTHAALDSREESISEESRAENKYDTHAQEAAYLAEGQARLVAELATALAAWRALVLPAAGHARVQVGSVVTLTTGSGSEVVFLGPANGGLTFPSPDAPGQEVTVITPISPLGRALLEHTVGDSLPPARKGGPSRRIARVE